MKPEITKYLNVYQYLQDYYQFCKKQSPGFSYDTWAQELRVNDKSYVRMMVIGKRPINEKMNLAFINNLAFDKKDADYFSILVQYTQSKTQESKNLFGKKLIQLLKNDLDQIEIEAEYEFLSNPLLPRLHVFLTFQDLDQSLKNLAWLLGSNENEIENSLKKLTEMKLIEFKNNRYSTLKKTFKVPQQFGNLGLSSFYRQNLEAAQSAIDLPPEQRRFKSLFMPMNHEEFNLFITNLNQFATEQLALFSSDEYKNRRLYQAHFNIFPVSSEAQPVASCKYQNNGTLTENQPFVGDQVKA